ncbi:rRNA pseudouridine synthase [Mycoplasmopsis mucosicanis]|uniref:rRNA pseudouridine synthase n=1 Tax=Mycoplasmopsis mucosicanis TaxID=458208 RepID=A0A507SIR4_9BACT|nr:pseudouridine synthase [Mycoplasmopsis mucosicanis]TQC51610.1 rRNA pseudouridine synthase [Mycoplasmopsis mucosicanis]
MNELLRVQKIIAQSGFCSRRQAEQYIEEGKVKINGIIAKKGDKASINDTISINNVQISTNTEKLVYYVLNKPRKTLSTLKDEFGRATVVQLVPQNPRVVPVGRLDYDTTGTLLLTNDLELVNKLTHPRYEISRIYRVRIDEPLKLKEFNLLNKGIEVNGKMSYQVVDQVENKSYLVELHVGSYHHVKKLFEAVGRKVLNLKRVSFANINVEKMPEGTYRNLTIKEVKDLKNLVRMQEEKLQKTSKNE